MKQRVISAVIALLIAIPLVLLGGIYFNLFALIIGILGLKEILKAKGNIPIYMEYISYILFCLFMIVGIVSLNDGGAFLLKAHKTPLVSLKPVKLSRRLLEAV